MRYSHDTALKWFRASVALGLVINVAFGLLALLAPRSLESLLDVGTTNALHWLHDVGILLLVLSAMYVPAIRDPFRYLGVVYVLVFGRLAAGMLFLAGVLFMNYPPGMKLPMSVDLVLSGVQAVLVFLMLRAGDPRSGYRPRFE